ncbi:MAG TPA: class I SAM-dependent methyltransferase [Blastocatellia bacterium]|nr:class I SAM-dependent methyltransferase [Blastocatellia bacterium]
MSSLFSYNNAEFDEYAAEYDAALQQGLSISGEDKNYFARGRIAWLAGCLGHMGERPKAIMDFGCGTGSSTPYLFDLLGAATITGVDISQRSLETARRVFGSDRSQFLLFSEHEPREAIDLAFSNGVFHHIPPDERAQAVDYVYRSLCRGGLFALWENNPWNPGTRLVMSRIPFDRDAIMLSSLEAKRLLRSCGLEVLRTDFLFIFPRQLKWLRALEPALSRLPLGAQYQIICRKI